MNLEETASLVAGASALILVVLAGIQAARGRAPSGVDASVRESVPVFSDSLSWTAGWRASAAALLLRTVLLAVLGFTPLGARLVRLLAPGGGAGQVALACLVILAAAAATGLPRVRYQRKARWASPELIRPAAKGWRSAVAWLILAVCVYVILYAALWAAVQSPFAYTAAEFWGGMTLSFLWSSLLVPSRFLKLPRPDRLAAVLDSLPVRPPRTVAALGWPVLTANAAAVGCLSRQSDQVIVVAPPLAERLSDPQLRAIMAHEAAHLLHRDRLWRGARQYLMVLSAGAAAIALNGVPALRDIAGASLPPEESSLPFLLAVAYLVYRVLFAVSLVATRAEERMADRRMLTAVDPQDCVEAFALMHAMLGIPSAWTRAQKLLTAAHPACDERLQAMRPAAGAGPVANHPA